MFCPREGLCAVENIAAASRKASRRAWQPHPIPSRGHPARAGSPPLTPPSPLNTTIPPLTPPPPLTCRASRHVVDSCAIAVLKSSPAAVANGLAERTATWLRAGDAPSRADRRRPAAAKSCQAATDQTSHARDGFPVGSASSPSWARAPAVGGRGGADGGDRCGGGAAGGGEHVFAAVGSSRACSVRGSSSAGGEHRGCRHRRAPWAPRNWSPTICSLWFGGHGWLPADGWDSLST